MPAYPSDLLDYAALVHRRAIGGLFLALNDMVSTGLPLLSWMGVKSSCLLWTEKIFATVLANPNYIQYLYM
jgi:hypothetical protein